MISDVIVKILVVISLVAVGIVMSQPFMPLFHRMELDRTCNNYFNQMVLNTSSENIGLSDADITALRIELSDRGFMVTSISATSNTSYGDVINLTVKITREYKELKGDLTYNVKTLAMTYKNSSKGLGI